MPEPIKSDYLKEKFRAAAIANESTRIRIHRALSWLKCAEDCGENIDLKFISLWISFNAGYAGQNTGDYALTEEQHFKDFVNRLIELDHSKIIFDLLWDKFSGPVRLLIENKFAFKTFWSAQLNEAINWENQFKRSNAKALNYLSGQRVAELLAVVLDRLYTVRNQLIHGNATYQSYVNRAQVKDAVSILSFLIPVMLGIMIEHGSEDWGEINYPVLQDQ
jgi:hypothetical protein